MKSFAAVALLVSVVVAQSSLIPTGISTGCSQFLTQLNNDTSLSSCTAPIINATSQFGPNGATTSKPSASAVSSALTNLCSSASQCPDTTIRSTLADFYKACTPELTTAVNPDVLRTYDVLYSIYPMQTAVCAKDASGKYCATQSPSSSAPASALWSTLTGLTVSGGSGPDKSAQVVIPNVQTFKSDNVVFLLLNAAMPAASLCTDCTRSILTSFISFESNVPYAPGLNNSALLGGQSALYGAVQNTCGKTFLNGAVQAAGGLSGGILSSAAPRTASAGASGVVGAVLGAVAVAFAAMV